ncbi:MAG: RHS repeat-associated core domain-containing protein, partial [Vicinamibacterales bacterium]
EETGFAYHDARYYAPWLGRWTSCDPTGLDDGINLYTYVSGRPVDLVDVTGKNGAKPVLNQSLAAPAPTQRYAFDTYANQCKIPQSQRVGGVNLQAHHPYQVAWAEKNVAGFSKGKAISQFLETKGDPNPASRGEHTQIGVDQNANRPAGGDWTKKSFSQMRQEAVSQYENAGLMNDAKQGRLALDATDGQYFETNDTPVVDPKTNKPVVNELGVQEVAKAGPNFKANLESSGPGKTTQLNFDAISEVKGGPESGSATPEGAFSVFLLVLTAWSLHQTNKSFKAAYQRAVAENSQQPLDDEARRMVATWGYGLALSAIGSEFGGPLGGLLTGLVGSNLGSKVIDAQLAKEARARRDPEFKKKYEHIEAFKDDVFGF